VQSKQLLPKGEVLQEEFFSGAKDGEDPPSRCRRRTKIRDDSEKRAGQMFLQVIDSAIVQSFGEAQGWELPASNLRGANLDLSGTPWRDSIPSGFTTKNT